MNQTKPVNDSLLCSQQLGPIQVWLHSRFLFSFLFLKRTFLRRSRHTCLISFLLSVIAAPSLTERGRRPDDLRCDWTQWNKTRCESPVHLRTAVSSGRRGLCEAWKRSIQTEGTRRDRAQLHLGLKESLRAIKKWREMFCFLSSSSTFSSPTSSARACNAVWQCAVSKGTKPTKKCNNNDNVPLHLTQVLLTGMCENPFRQKPASWVFSERSQGGRKL